MLLFPSLCLQVFLRILREHHNNNSNHRQYLCADMISIISRVNGNINAKSQLK